MTEKRFIIFQDYYDDLYIQDKEVYRATGIKVGNEEDVKYKNVSKIVKLLNELHEENEELKQEVELLRSGLEAYDDNLPVYLTCKEVMEFHSDVYDFKKKEQSFYKEHPNRCKIIVDGVELK